MSELITRAEQGLLGALLRDGIDASITANLERDDFGHHTHQALYQALAETDMMADGSLQERIATVVTIAEVDLDAAWLAVLAERAPAAALVADYARIVLEAAFDRDVADFGQEYRDLVELATDPPLVAALTRLADGLDAQAAVFTSGSEIDAAVDVTVNGAGVQVGIDLVLDREDQVIADIVQHPEQGAAVGAWLESEVFTTEQRRFAFELAVSQAYDNDPFDTVTLAWQLQRARDVSRYHHHGLAVPAEADYAYLARLQAVTVETGTAVVVGRELLVEHVKARHEMTVTAGVEYRVQIEQPPPGLQQAQLQAPLEQTPSIDIRPIEL